ncbi:MAG: histidinol-phosphatase HisJ family protein [Eggerthellaceae bacterium]|nr:histidinol-phosphatase HisJ family protein [Eggerthellaceae bacterium]
MELVNTHTHTVYSGHGEGSVAELVHAASLAQISSLAITEHYILSPAFDPAGRFSIPEKSLEQYCTEILQARELYPHMEILLGCELDWLGSWEDRSLTQAELGRFDVVLGSVHFLDGWVLDAPSSHEGWHERGFDAVWESYFKIWCEAVLSEMPFTIMAHPDLVKKFGYYPAFDPRKLYEQAAEACRVAGRMVEVNTSGALWMCREMYPSAALLREFHKAGVPCSIGTDAHSPKDVARGIDAALRLLYECGYREVTVPTKDKDRRSVTIE